MKINPTPLLAAAMLMLASVSSQAADAPKEDAAFAAKLISAIENADFNAFIGDGNEAVKAMKKEQFDAVVTQLGPKLKARNELTYLGDLKQMGYHVTLWKLTFKDGSDDALVTLSVKDGKVGGFSIK